MTTADRESAGGAPKVCCRGLWRVFGPQPERVVAPAYVPLPPDEVLAKTGCVAAVRDLSFDVHEGEVFVVMGLSGSGKSTLIRCLTRLIEPTAGTITLDGEDILAISEERLRHLRRHKFGMVFQEFGLLPTRTVFDNIAYNLEIRGDPRRQRREQVQDLVDLVGLRGFERAYPDELSGGMKQRVGLARALATDPDLLFLDEPFSALDPLIRAEMQEEVVRLQRELRKTLIFISHDLREALRLGDRIAVMRDGVMVQVGTAVDLLERPADDYVQAFTRDVPRELVLTAIDVCDRATPAPNDPPVSAGTALRDILPVIARYERVRVLDESGGLAGTASRERVLSALYGAPVEGVVGSWR